MRALHLGIILIYSLLGQLHAAEEKWHEFVAPNKCYAVRLREGYAIGNCRYDEAQLMDLKAGKMLFDFGPEHNPSVDLGGYEQNSVVWAPDSRFVAVYFHSHREGAPLVVSIAGDVAVACSVPEISLPHENDPANAGRNVQTWVKPVKWLPKSNLLLIASGLIQQAGFRIGYSYEVQLHFDDDGNGILKLLKRKSFVRERAE